MSKVIRCERGHYYDSIAYAQCPHCQGSANEFSSATEYHDAVARYALQYLKDHTKKERVSEDGTLLLYSSSAAKNKKKEQEKTVALNFEKKDDYFVTGWLVVVDGPEKGHSYGLHYGYNTIGRLQSNAVSLWEDEDVEPQVHCSIVYEDRKNTFHLVPEAEFPIYLNSDIVQTAMQMKSGDILKVGACEMEFIAFCRDDRKWDKKDMQKHTKR